MRYFTKEWYILLQKWGRTFDRKEKSALKGRLDAISAAFQQAREKENLPEELREKFFFHDGEIRKIQEGTDYVIELSSPFSQYTRVTFCNALVKQDRIPAGAIWLYEELYRHALGYEAHILCSSGLELRDAKIICTDIRLEKDFQS